MDALSEVFKIVGGPRALAKKLGVTVAAVYQWDSGHRPIPPARCLAIERATAGAVTRADLRPHDYWLIWPDLPAPEQKNGSSPC